jgi:membrane-associated protease RseP (regulator of RpoE activity)
MTHPRFVKRFVAIGLAALLAACASGFSQFYKPVEGMTPDMIAATRVAPATGQPLIERAAPPGSDAGPLLDAYAKRGYVVIGSSSFNSGRAESEDAAVQHGVKVGADLVLVLHPRYTGSTTSSIPVTVPTTSTSYSSGSATAYGRGGPVTAYGTSTTTTYGTSTTMIPVTVNRSDYGAMYFVKRKWAFGALWRDLDDAERQEIQSNKGVRVLVVVDNTPAYQADVLPGDFILAVDGHPVLNNKSITDLMRARAGQTVALSLYRRGIRLEKSVRLLPV